MPGNASAVTAPYFNPDTDELPVNIEAIHMEYDKKRNYLFAEGEVEIKQGNRVLKADFIKINLITKDTEARGNVVLFEGEDKIVCDSFNINLDSQLGNIQHAKIYLKEQNIYIQGNEINRRGPNSYFIKDGKITTCDGKNPAWHINAENIDVTIEGYAKVRNSTFHIKGLPVFYLPYAFFPVKTKRQTGLLFPEFGHSSSEGIFINNSFFWALSENTDSTMWLDYASKKGLGSGLEYRFKLKDNTWGKAYGYFINEQNSYFDEQYRDQRDRDHLRAYINFEGEHYFADNFYIKAQGSHITDREVYGDYRNEIRRSKGEVNRTSLRSREKDESLVFLNKNWGSHNLLVNVDVYKNLIFADPATLQRLPRSRFSSMRRSLAGSALFYQYDFSYNNFWREDGQKGHRLDIFPKISLPVNKGGWLKFNSEVGVRAISYFNLHHNQGIDKEGLFPGIRSELSLNFIKFYAPDLKWLSKVKHTIEPGLLYEFVPSNDQGDLPEFDITESFYRRHSLSYYLKHRFSGLLKNGSGESSESEIGYFLIGQSYNITRPKGGLYLVGDPAKDFSDIFAEIRLGFFPTFYIKAKAAYSPYDNSLRSYNALLSLRNQRGDYIQFQYRYARKKFEIFDIRGRLHLTRSLQAYFDARYDNLENEDLDTEFGIDYSAQCWGSKFSIETSGGTGGRSSDISFNYSFYLKGLGNIL